MREMTLQSGKRPWLIRVTDSRDLGEGIDLRKAIGNSCSEAIGMQMHLPVRVVKTCGSVSDSLLVLAKGKR